MLQMRGWYLAQTNISRGGKAENGECTSAFHTTVVWSRLRGIECVCVRKRDLCERLEACMCKNILYIVTVK